MRFKPCPGVVVIQLIKTPSDKNQLNYGQDTTSKIKKGKVIAVGDDDITSGGAQLLMKDYAKVGDIMYFLTYEGEYDQGKVEQESYHFVKIADLRSRVYEK